MFGLSLGEVLILAAIALIVIGPEDLPKLARQIGRFVNDIKRSTQSFTEDLKEQAKFDPQEFLKQREEYQKHIQPEDSPATNHKQSDEVSLAEKNETSKKEDPT